MKYLVFIYSNLLLALLLSLQSPAQSASTGKSNNDAVLEQSYPRVLSRFAELYPAATGQLWVKEDGYLYVSFIDKGNKVSATFTSRGHMNYAITQLPLSAVPAAILQKIRHSYPAYTVFNTREITVDNNVSYEMIVENNAEYVVVSISQDGLEEVKTVSKF